MLNGRPGRPGCPLGKSGKSVTEVRPGKSGKSTREVRQGSPPEKSGKSGKTTREVREVRQGSPSLMIEPNREGDGRRNCFYKSISRWIWHLVIFISLKLYNGHEKGVGELVESVC